MATALPQPHPDNRRPARPAPPATQPAPAAEPTRSGARSACPVTALQQYEQDVCGIIATYRASQEIPPAIAILNPEWAWHRKWAGLLVQGLFANALDTPTIHVLWKLNVFTILRTRKLRLIWPSTLDP
jgi:hypothetical protein